jgi:alkyl sulfatase BDS1-like metallo-beta-lactamase superfamily hydrolase
MADLLALSARIIDSGVVDEPVNRVTQELSELAPDLSVIESFSHVVTFATEEGLVCFDASGAGTGPAVVESLRRWRSDRIHSLVYTHGHLDHVGGSGAFVADAEQRSDPTPRVVGHANVPTRLARYEKTSGYNMTINLRQFGGVRAPGLGVGGARRFLPRSVAAPDVTFQDRLAMRVGELEFELRHARGETDDHLWAWVPERKVICAGDFFIWNFPNAGNPQKVQRYPVEWAAALREMAAMGAELFVPAHGLPIGGAARIRGVLDDVATALERLIERTLEMMNAGEPLDAIVHEVRVPADVLEKPYLRPLYDEPEFVVRNLWRLYGGWYDGNPANLKPAPQSALATELAALAGGARELAKRARELADGSQLRLACHLVELAAAAAPDDAEVHAARADVYARRRKAEPSLMAKGIFADAMRQSQAKAGSK